MSEIGLMDYLFVKEEKKNGKKHRGMWRYCNYCGELFIVSISQLKSGIGKFCCIKCSNKHNGEQRKKVKIKKICPACGKEYEIFQYEINRRIYCSKECQYIGMSGENNWAWNGGKKTVICDYCGKEIKRKPSQISDINFCCKNCQYKHYGINQTGNKNHQWKGGKIKCTCQICGKEFEVKQNIKNNGYGIYCSRICKGIGTGKEHHYNWKGGISYLPYCEKFNENKREEIREKHGRECFICGKSEEENGSKLSVHHINYRKHQGCNGEKWSLLPLCRSCHTKTNHKRLYWEFAIKYKLYCLEMENES